MVQDELRKQLQAQTKEWLIDRLCDLTLYDDIATDRILLFLAAREKSESDIITEFNSKLDKAIKQIREHGGYDWRAPMPTEALCNVADALAEVINNDAYAVLEIAEYALLKIDSIRHFQDECELDYVIHAFRDLHLEVCYRLKPDPVHFGKHLAELANKTEYGLFNGPPDGYAQVLGQQGLTAYAVGLKSKR
jgi:hypothetical protein